MKEIIDFLFSSLLKIFPLFLHVKMRDWKNHLYRLWLKPYLGKFDKATVCYPLEFRGGQIYKCRVWNINSGTLRYNSVG